MFSTEQILIDEIPYRVKVAATTDQRRMGLSNCSDIGADGMLFSYEYPVFRPFHMSRTIIPLTIAFFDQNMNFIGSRDMEPRSTVPILPPSPFRYAIEFPADATPPLEVGKSRLKRPLRKVSQYQARLQSV